MMNLGRLANGASWSLVLACAGLSVALGSVAEGQHYPDRPVRLINGFAAGGNADVVARLIGQKLSERLGQPIVHESRVGAGTAIANAAVARSEPDGHTLLLVSGAFPTTAAAAKALTYDPVEDFSWVGMIVSYPLAVIVRPDAPYASLPSLIEAAKASPGKLTYPSPGNGSLVHLAVESFNSAAGTEMLHVPFRGGAEPLTELMAGRMDVAFETLTFASPHIASGKIKALAVTSGRTVSLLPSVPPVAATLPGYEAISFLGIAAPRKTPREVTGRLQRELSAVMADPTIQARLTDLGGAPWSAQGDTMKDFVAGEIRKWREVIAKRKIETP